MKVVFPWFHGMFCKLQSLFNLNESTNLEVDIDEGNKFICVMVIVHVFLLVYVSYCIVLTLQ